MTYHTRTFAELCVSPLNVRKNLQDQTETSATEASIARIGLIYPLMIHPVTPELIERYPDFAEWTDSALFGVFAGGRRLRAIGKLIAAGRLPSDWPINCDFRDLDPIRDAALITQISHAENFIGRDLRDYETHAAVRDAAERGAGVDEIADALDQTPEWVTKQLRLGRLHEPIFEAYAAGKLTYDHARAYAATEDTALQAQAWAHFAGKKSWESEPRQIRAFYRVGDREAAKLLRFVGTTAYRAAGGRSEPDLFSDSGAERIADEDLLRRLAEERLATERDRIRVAAQAPDLQFISAPPSYAGGTDWSLQVEVSDKTRGGVRRIELDELTVVATLTIAESGNLELAWWWPSRKAKAAASKSGAGSPAAPPPPSGTAIPPGSALNDSSGYGYGQQARAAVKAEFGLTGDGIHVCRSLRRALARAMLIANAGGGGTVGRDYLIWSQLRHELTGEGSAITGARHLGSAWRAGEDAEPRDVVKPHLAGCAADAAFEGALQLLRAEPFIALKDPGEAFLAYLAVSEEDKTIAASVLAGLALERSLAAPGWEIPVHTVLAAALGADDATLRQLFQPGPEFAALFPKMYRLELVQGLVEPSVLASWAKQPDPVISGAVAAALDPASHSDPVIAARAATRLHPLLSFGVADPAEPADPDLDRAPVAEPEPGIEPQLEEAL